MAIFDQFFTLVHAGIYRDGLQPGALLQPPPRLRPPVPADGLREGARQGKKGGKEDR